MRSTRMSGNSTLQKFSIALLAAFIGGPVHAEQETPMIKEVSIQIIGPLTGPNSKVPDLMKKTRYLWDRLRHHDGSRWPHFFLPLAIPLAIHVQELAGRIGARIRSGTRPIII